MILEAVPIVIYAITVVYSYRNKHLVVIYAICFVSNLRNLAAVCALLSTW